MTFKFNTEREAHEFYSKQAEEKKNIITLVIEVTHEEQVSVEEYCRTHGVHINRYLMKLHENHLAFRDAQRYGQGTFSPSPTEVAQIVTDNPPEIKKELDKHKVSKKK